MDRGCEIASKIIEQFELIRKQFGDTLEAANSIRADHVKYRVQENIEKLQQYVCGLMALITTQPVVQSQTLVPALQQAQDQAQVDRIALLEADTLALLKALARDRDQARADQKARFKAKVRAMEETQARTEAQALVPDVELNAVSTVSLEATVQIQTAAPTVEVTPAVEPAEQTPTPRPIQDPVEEVAPARDVSVNLNMDCAHAPADNVELDLDPTQVLEVAASPELDMNLALILAQELITAPIATGSDDDEQAQAQIVQQLRDSVLNREQFVQMLNELEFGSKYFLEMFEAGEERFLDGGNVPITICDNGFIFKNKITETNDKLKDVHLVRNKDGLKMELPYLTFDNLTDYISETTLLEILNVETQSPETMSLGDFVQLMTDENELSERNVYNLTLEVSRSPDFETLENAITVPEFVSDHSMIKKIKDTLSKMKKDIENNKELVDAEKMRKRNIVAEMERTSESYEKCLILSSKGSITNVRMERSGSSAYCHVIKGQKIFYVTSLTVANLQKYNPCKRGEPGSGWKGAVFNKDFTRIVVNPEETIFLPSGVIHFTYTPKDSIAVGGKFLHTDSLELQFIFSNYERRRLRENHFVETDIWKNFYSAMFTYVEIVFIEILEDGLNYGQNYAENNETGHVFMEYLTKYSKLTSSERLMGRCVNNADQVLARLKKRLSMKQVNNQKRRAKNAGPPPKRFKK